MSRSTVAQLALLQPTEELSHLRATVELHDLGRRPAVALDGTLNCGSFCDGYLMTQRIWASNQPIRSRP
jgi:hypothetical protein